jgi:hypothetical protein
MLKRSLQSSLSVPDHHLTASAGVSENAVASFVNAKKRLAAERDHWMQRQLTGLNSDGLEPV